jgi:hypothetical protein
MTSLTLQLISRYIGIMKLYGRILAYFYAVSLSLLGMAFSQYDYLIPENQSIKPEISTEVVGSLDQPDKLYLFSQCNFYAGSYSGCSHPEIDRFFEESSFQDLYWKISEAIGLSFLGAVNVQFEATDIIYPFHFFW